MAKLVVDSISCGYSASILSNMSFTVNPGEFIGVVGPNGAGKSTLIKAISGILPITSGQIIIDGQKLSSLTPQDLAKKVAVVGQSYSVGFDYKVSDIVSLGRFAHVKKSPDSIKPFLQATDIWQFRNRSFHELSGGEKQRVIISQALAQEASLLLLDEPTSDLDIHHQSEVFKLLSKLRKEKQLTIFAVLHDLNLASLYCDRIMALRDGRIEFDGPPSAVITKENIDYIYDVDVEVLDSKNYPFVMLNK